MWTRRRRDVEEDGGGDARRSQAELVAGDTARTAGSRTDLIVADVKRGTARVEVYGVDLAAELLQRCGPAFIDGGRSGSKSHSGGSADRRGA